MISGENAGSFYESRVEKYKESRQNIIDGNINCIPNPFPKFRSIFPGIEQERYYLVTGNEKSGKCFGKGTLVRMFDGSTKRVEDVIIGDLLLGPDSVPRRVANTHSGRAKMYEITQNKGGKTFTVNGEHILHLYRQHKVFNMSVKEYLSKSESFQKECCQMAKFPDKEVLYRNFTIKEIGEDHYYGFEVDGDHLFLLDDYTIVHNSQVSDYLFFIHPLMYAYENPDKLKVKVLYFSLEMSKPVKFDQLICHWLYVHTQGRVRVSTKKLNSLSEPLDPSVLTILESDEFKDFFNFLEENTMFFDGVSNPTGIYSKCKKFAESRGSYTYRDMDWEDNVTKKVTKRRVIDTFVKDNKEEYWIVITDHLSLLSTESGMDLRNTIDKFSSNYCSQLRNRYGFTIVNIQQQSATSQDNESFKLDRLMPHPGNLAESKSTKNDLNVMFGIFAPIRFKKRLFEGYNIDVFKDNIRFLELILDRNGISGIMCPLYFDGAVNYFAELPPPDGNIEVFENMAINAQNNRI